MNNRAVKAAVVGFLVMALGAAAHAADQPSINQISLEVSALSTLYDLQATPEQVAALQKLAAGTATTQPADEGPKVSGPYRSALTALRDALAGHDEDEVTDSQDRVDTLEEDMKDVPNPDIETTDVAKARSAAALKLFTASQVAGFISGHSGDVPDIKQQLLDAADEVRAAEQADVAETIAETADDVATLIAGYRAKARQPAEDAVKSFLEKARAMKQDDFKAKQPELQQQAAKIEQMGDPVAVIGHWMQQQLAQVLANPQLAPALEARLKAEKTTEPAPTTEK